MMSMSSWQLCRVGGSLLFGGTNAGECDSGTMAFVMIINGGLTFFPISLVHCRSVQNLCLDKIQGFILNVPSRVSLGIVSLPLRRRHWLAVREVNGQFYNLDSKLKGPACIGGETELR